MDLDRIKSLRQWFEYVVFELLMFWCFAFDPKYVYEHMSEEIKLLTDLIKLLGFKAKIS